MRYEFAQNEFTSWDILEYLRLIYGTQINGSPFTSGNIQNWIRSGKLPEFYVGYKIAHTERYKEQGNLLVITVEGLSREQLIEIAGSLSNYAETSNRRRKADVIPKIKRPRKLRTQLYYKTLEKIGKQSTKRTLNNCILPNNWKESGIKANQLVLKKNRKKRA